MPFKLLTPKKILIKCLLKLLQTNNNIYKTSSFSCIFIWRRPILIPVAELDIQTRVFLFPSTQNAVRRRQLQRSAPLEGQIRPGERHVGRADAKQEWPHFFDTHLSVKKLCTHQPTAYEEVNGFQQVVPDIYFLKC